MLLLCLGLLPRTALAEAVSLLKPTPGGATGAGLFQVRQPIDMGATTSSLFIGRYQFIPKTLERVVNKLGVDPGQRFSKQLQDQLGDGLLVRGGFQPCSQRKNQPPRVYEQSGQDMDGPAQQQRQIH